MEVTGIYYLLEGIAISFFTILSLQNLWNRGNRLRMILGGILLYWMLQYIISLVFTADFLTTTRYYSPIINTLDMTAEPTCCFLLLELCRPGWLTWRKVLRHELPFVTLGAIYLYTLNDQWYYVLLVLFVGYGIGTFIAILISLHQYNRFLRAHYSYEENVNLRWLLITLITFFVLMFIYAITSSYDTILGDCIYVGGSILSWAWICFCIARQESVLNELEAAAEEEKLLALRGAHGDASLPFIRRKEIKREEMVKEKEFAEGTVKKDSQINEECMSKEKVINNGGNITEGKEHPLALAIAEHFVASQLYLRPELKLGDMASAIGTNRTYLSRYLNDELHTTFYDFVNAHRLAYAIRLLKQGETNMTAVSIQSGFNSYSTFRRVFMAKYELSPKEYCNANN